MSRVLGGWRDRVARLARVGVLPTDTPDEALRKETLVLFASVITVLSFVWVGTYAALGLYVSAAIPLAYQLSSVLNLAVFARRKRYRFFRAWTLALALVLPFLLQLSLGGFIPSSAVVLWSFTAPLGALLFSGREEAARWFAAFVGVIVLSAALDPQLTSADIPHWIVIAFFALNIVGVTGTAFLLLSYFVRERERAAAVIASERERSERLLLNVLPAPIAERLKSGESPIADRTAEVGVLFADIVGFTPLAERMRPDDLVLLLDDVFSLFDELVAKHGLEKIKTIGDAYMVASGLLGAEEHHARRLASTALEMQEAIARTSPLTVRIGIDIGPVIAGVIGRQKFIYDLWGDTVNTAGRMEAQGIPGAIQVTERVYERLAPAFVFEERGTIEVRGKGPMRTYLLVASREGAPERTSGGTRRRRAPVAGGLLNDSKGGRFNEPEQGTVGEGRLHSHRRRNARKRRSAREGHRD
jgi:guanylate cyclase